MVGWLGGWVVGWRNQRLFEKWEMENGKWKMGNEKENEKENEKKGFD